MSQPAIRRIGLTGGIGSGKSTVGAMLAARGATLIDTDAIARQLTEPGGAAIDAIRRMCGHDVPAIVITGDTTHGEMRRVSESGHPVLLKPVQPRRLYEAVRAALR